MRHRKWCRFFVPASPHSQDATQSFCTVSLRRCKGTVHVFGGFCGREGGFGCVVHVLAGFCGREGRFIVCRPRFWVFLWTGGWFSGVPSTFRGVFVDGSVVFGCAVHVFGGFCGRECPNRAFR